MNEVKVIPVEAGNKIALPAEWAAELHLAQTATLERLPDGILVRPAQPEERLTWDEIFAEKLKPGQVWVERDLSELSGDDLIF